MSLRKCLMDVLDLPSTLIYKEAPSKLAMTYMFVNGTLMYVNEISETYITVQTPVTYETKAIPADKVESLEVWLPKTGVYFMKGTHFPILLYRKPVRQWKRSFCPSFYEVIPMTPNNVIITDIDINSRKEFWVADDRSILYFNRKIGYVKNANSFVCTAESYQQELQDWMRG